MEICFVIQKSGGNRSNAIKQIKWDIGARVTDQFDSVQYHKMRGDRAYNKSHFTKFVGCKRPINKQIKKNNLKNQQQHTQTYTHTHTLTRIHRVQSERVKKQRRQKTIMFRFSSKFDEQIFILS